MLFHLLTGRRIKFLMAGFTFCFFLGHLASASEVTNGWPVILKSCHYPSLLRTGIHGLYISHGSNAITHVDFDGKVQWTYRFTNAVNPANYAAMEVDASGAVLAVIDNYFSETNILVRIGPDGTQDWVKSFYEPRTSPAITTRNHLFLFPDGKIAFNAFGRSSSTSYSSAYSATNIYVISPEGDIVYSQYLTNISDAWIKGDHLGNLYVITTRPSPQVTSFYKFAPDGTLARRHDFSRSYDLDRSDFILERNGAAWLSLAGSLSFDLFWISSNGQPNLLKTIRDPRSNAFTQNSEIVVDSEKNVFLSLTGSSSGINYLEKYSSSRLQTEWTSRFWGDYNHSGPSISLSPQDDLWIMEGSYDRAFNGYVRLNAQGQEVQRISLGNENAFASLQHSNEIYAAVRGPWEPSCNGTVELRKFNLPSSPIGSPKFSGLPGQLILTSAVNTVQTPMEGITPIQYQILYESGVRGPVTDTITFTHLSFSTQPQWVNVIASNAAGVTISPTIQLLYAGPAGPLGYSGEIQRFIQQGNYIYFDISTNHLVPSTYQWYHNKRPTAGATNAVRFIQNTTYASAGDYYLVNSNSYGVFTSVVFRVTIWNPASLQDALETRVSWETDSANPAQGMIVSSQGSEFASIPRWIEANLRGPAVLEFRWRRDSSDTTSYLTINSENVLTNNSLEWVNEFILLPAVTNRVRFVSGGATFLDAVQYAPAGSFYLTRRTQDRMEVQMLTEVTGHYVIEATSNFVDWSRLLEIVGKGGLEKFYMDTFEDARFYRARTLYGCDRFDAGCE